MLIREGAREVKKRTIVFYSPGGLRIDAVRQDVQSKKLPSIEVRL